MSYHDYIYFKKKYLELKQEGGNKDNFYFVHWVIGDNGSKLYKILKSGQLKLGTNLNKSELRGTGGIPEPHIYANIDFNPINIIGDIDVNGIILKSSIMSNQSIYFNKRWRRVIDHNSVRIDPTDSKSNKNKKIKMIKRYLKKNNKNKDRYEYWFSHEIVLDQNVDLNQHLAGIIVPKHMETKFKKLINNKYKRNIKIFTFDFEK